MSAGDLFDESNKFYREAVDDPLKIIEPLGMSFFNNKEIFNNKRSAPHHNQNLERQPAKAQHSIIPGKQNDGSSSTSSYNKNPNQSQRRNNMKKISIILPEKDKQLEKMSYNKVSQIRTDLAFLEKIRCEVQKGQKSLLSDNDFKSAFQNFDREEYIHQYTKIVDQIKMEHYDNLKAIKCQNLLKMLTGFVKKNSQVSTCYHVFGSFENIGYIEYLKKDIELNMTTSVLSLWLQQTPKQKNLKNSSRYGEVDIYIKETNEVNIESGEQVRAYINALKEQAQEQDISYEGLDLYMGVRSCPATEGYNEQEKQCQKRMMFDLVMICHLLADQQNCIIKFYNTFHTRTLMILYMFSKIFQTTVMTKPRTSSFASNARYLHCMNLKSDLARKLGEIILDKYEEFLQEDALLFDLKTLTQDLKFSTNFIEKFLKNLIRLQIDYFESEEVANHRYSDIVKQELQSIFSELYYKDIVESFQIEDLKLKRELGLKEKNLDEARKHFDQIEDELVNAANQAIQQRENQQQKQKQAQFSDDEDENEEDKIEASNSYVNQFIKNQRQKDEEEKQRQESKKGDGNSNTNNKPLFKKDPTIINQKIERDLQQTNSLIQSILPPMFIIPKKKK